MGYQNPMITKIVNHLLRILIFFLKFLPLGFISIWSTKLTTMGRNPHLLLCQNDEKLLWDNLDAMRGEGFFLYNFESETKHGIFR